MATTQVLLFEAIAKVLVPSNHFIPTVAKFGFIPLLSAACMLRNGGQLSVLLVDDRIAISLVQWVMIYNCNFMRSILSFKYKVRDLRELTEYLGLQIQRARLQSAIYRTTYSQNHSERLSFNGLSHSTSTSSSFLLHRQ